MARDFFEEYEQQERENRIFLEKQFEKQVTCFIQAFNLQEVMTSYYFNALRFCEYKESNSDKVLIQSCMKASWLLYNAHQLLLRGQYGIANTLLRQIYEYLLIGKYFYKKQDEALAEKWLNERSFDVYDKILRLLKSPVKSSLCGFWKVLCIPAHAGTSSVQIALNARYNQLDIKMSYHIVLLLLCCKHDLINCFYSSRELIRVLKMGACVYKELLGLKKESICLVDETAGQFSEEGVKMLKDYGRYWVFKK